jgi:hypothetical protein
MLECSLLQNMLEASVLAREFRKDYFSLLIQFFLLVTYAYTHIAYMVANLTEYYIISGNQGKLPKLAWWKAAEVFAVETISF